MGQGRLGSPWSSLQLCFEESCSMGLDAESDLCSLGRNAPRLCGTSLVLGVLVSPQCTLILAANLWPLCCPEYGLPLNSLIPL